MLTGTHVYTQWRSRVLSKFRGKRVEREPMTGVWSSAPSGVLGQSPCSDILWRAGRPFLWGPCSAEHA